MATASSGLQPRGGVDAVQVIDVLREVANRANDVASETMGPGGAGALDAYLKWTERAWVQLGNVFSHHDVEAFLRTSNYWALRQTTSGAPRLNAWVLAEVSDRARELEAAADEMVADQQRWKGVAALVVPDTSLFLGAVAIPDLDWPALIGTTNGLRLVLPLVVVDELDRLKRQGNNTTGTRSQDAIRWLDALLATGGGRSKPFGDAGLRQTVEVDGDHEPRAGVDADRQIIDYAAALHSSAARSVLLVTRDLGLKVRAELAGVEVTFVKDPPKPGKPGVLRGGS